MPENDADVILDATEELVRAVIQRNALTPDDMVSCIFTATEDLDAEFPAVAARRLGLDGLEDLRVRRKRRLVGGELDQLTLEGIRRGRRIDRDVVEAAVELEAGHCAPSRSRRRATASRRYTCFASMEASA